MHIKFLPHSTGSGRDAVEYLLGELDHQGRPREVVQVMRGDPFLTGKLIDSITRVHRYSSGVIAFGEDNPAPEDIDRLLNEFEKLAFAGLEPGEYDWCAVRHDDHIHIIVPQIHLPSGRQLNVAPPGWESIYDPLRDSWNWETGWARPDDPARARDLQPGNSIHTGAWKFGETPKQEIAEKLRDALVTSQCEPSRQGVLTWLEAHPGIAEISRTTKKAISVMLPGQKRPVRLEGKLFTEDFAGLDEVDLLAAREDQERHRMEKALQARVQLEKVIARRTENMQAQLERWRKIDERKRERAQRKREREQPAGDANATPGQPASEAKAEESRPTRRIVRDVVADATPAAGAAPAGDAGVAPTDAGADGLDAAGNAEADGLGEPSGGALERVGGRHRTADPELRDQLEILRGEADRAGAAAGIASAAIERAGRALGRAAAAAERAAEMAPAGDAEAAPTDAEAGIASAAIERADQSIRAAAAGLEEDHQPAPGASPEHSRGGRFAEAAAAAERADQSIRAAATAAVRTDRAVGEAAEATGRAIGVFGAFAVRVLDLVREVISTLSRLRPKPEPKPEPEPPKRPRFRP